MPGTELGHATMQKDTGIIQSGGAFSAKASSVRNVGSPSAAKDIDAGQTAAPIKVWASAIGDQTHSKLLRNAYRQWLDYKATRQPRLRDMYSIEANSFEDTMLTLKVGNQHVDISQNDSYSRSLGRHLIWMWMSTNSTEGVEKPGKPRR